MGRNIGDEDSCPLLCVTVASPALVTDHPGPLEFEPAGALA